MESTVIIILAGLNFVLLLLLLKKLSQGGVDRALREEFSNSRRESAELSRDLRQELQSNLEQLRAALEKRFENQRAGNDQKLELIRQTVEKRLELLQRDNAEKLEKMRATVDEKLQSTLEKRLNESFKLVGDRLEQVHKGLGEMQNLASDVSDFKRVLTNVKTRGTWGEVQLGSLLEQVFIKDHYVTQYAVNPDTKEVVDFAIKLPDKSSKKGYIFLPIDAKFPLEDYQRLVASSEQGDTAAVELSHKALVARIKLEAKNIKEKYINPPQTTDFAILYVPTEGLFAEILRTPGLFEQLQSEYRVTIAGPTNIAAILSSYQLGFRTLAIAEQTSKVWELLTTIKGDFTKFGDLLEKTKEKLDQASKNIDLASTKSRTIERRLSKVQLLEAKNEDD